MEPELAGEPPVLPDPVLPVPVGSAGPVLALAELQVDWSQYPSQTEQDLALQVLPYSSPTEYTHMPSPACSKQGFPPSSNM